MEAFWRDWQGMDIKRFFCKKCEGSNGGENARRLVYKKLSNVLQNSYPLDSKGQDHLISKVISACTCVTMAKSKAISTTWLKPHFWGPPSATFPHLIPILHPSYILHTLPIQSFILPTSSIQNSCLFQIYYLTYPYNPVLVPLLFSTFNTCPFLTPVTHLIHTYGYLL